MLTIAICQIYEKDELPHGIKNSKVLEENSHKKPQFIVYPTGIDRSEPNNELCGEIAEKLIGNKGEVQRYETDEGPFFVAYKH